MRLWTILPKDFERVFETHEYFLYDESYSDRVKLYDEQYIEDKQQEDGSIKTAYPIYCFASFEGHKGQTLSIERLYSDFSELIRPLSGPLCNYMFVELCVEEYAILNAKCRLKSYVKYDEAWRNDRQSNKYKYASLSDVDDICTTPTKYFKYVRDSAETRDIECVMKSIKDYQVVKTWSITPVKDNEGYTAYMLNATHCSNLLLSFLNADICVGTDGYPRETVNGILTRVSLDMRKEIRQQFGMGGFYVYMTVYEAAVTCDSQTCDAIRKYMIKNNIDIRENANTELCEIYNTDKFILTSDELIEMVSTFHSYK